MGRSTGGSLEDSAYAVGDMLCFPATAIVWMGAALLWAGVFLAVAIWSCWRRPGSFGAAFLRRPRMLCAAIVVCNMLRVVGSGMFLAQQPEFLCPMMLSGAGELLLLPVVGVSERLGGGGQCNAAGAVDARAPCAKRQRCAAREPPVALMPRRDGTSELLTRAFVFGALESADHAQHKRMVVNDCVWARLWRRNAQPRPHHPLCIPALAAAPVTHAAP